MKDDEKYNKQNRRRPMTVYNMYFTITINGLSSIRRPG